MAKGIYVGISGVKQSKKIYVGVGSVRKVKRIFVGLGGVKLAYSSQLSTLIQSTPLSINRYSGGFSKAGNSYLVYCCGYQSSPFEGSPRVDAFDKQYVIHRPSSQGINAGEISSASLGSYSISAGGVILSSGRTNEVQCYNTSLVKTTVFMSSVAGASGCATNTHALFGSGYDGSFTRMLNAFNTSLVRTFVYDAVIAYNSPAGSNGLHGIYAKFSNNSAGTENIFRVISTSLTISDLAMPTSNQILTNRRGGNIGNLYSIMPLSDGRLAAITPSLTISYISAIPHYNNYFMSGVSDQMLIGCGRNSSNNLISTVISIDNNLVKQNMPNFPHSVGTIESTEFNGHIVINNTATGMHRYE